MAGMIRQNVRFAFAAKGRVIVTTGRMEPIHLGEHVPYVQGGDTLTVITDHAYGDGNAMVPLHNIVVSFPRGRVSVASGRRPFPLATRLPQEARLPSDGGPGKAFGTRSYSGEPGVRPFAVRSSGRQEVFCLFSQIAFSFPDMPVFYLWKGLR